MSRTVFCKKHQTELAGLEKPPFPGQKGQDIYDNVSAKAWQEWLDHQTRIINEKQLKLFEPETKVYLQEQMTAFFANKSVDAAEGYVPVNNSADPLREE